MSETIPVKECDHTSVGILVWQGDKLLLIERKKFPFGFAPPAGHNDGDSYRTAAERELKEEVGLLIEKLRLVARGKKHNLCRRQNGTWHRWRIYSAEATGGVIPAEDEVKQFSWSSKNQIKKLTKRTEDYLGGKISERGWQKSPGLEPVWYEWLKELKII